MTELADILNCEIYPLVFERIDTLFPEFEFKRKGSHWVSSNTLKIDGTHGDSKGKVYIYQDHPHYIKDFRSDGCEITKYLQDKGITASWVDSVKFLANEVGYQLHETISMHHNKQPLPVLAIYEALNDLFTETLSKEPKNGKHWKYLSQRGYTGLLSCEDTANDTYHMELGVAPSREVQKSYLLKRGFTEEEIKDNFLYSKKENKEVNKSIGFSHTLTIPFRDISGRIIGFAVRNLDYKEGGEKTKYIVTNGLKRADKLFNLTSRKYEHLNLVEGYLDALYAKALGMPNVVALGSAGFNEIQAKLLESMGTKTVTLALDQDNTGKGSTEKVIEILRKECPSIKIHVIPSYNGYKDPDELIRAQGIDAFQEAINKASDWYIYHLDILLKSVTSPITDKERHSVVNSIMRIGTQLEPYEREIFVRYFQKIGTVIGISSETLSKTLEEQTKLRQEESFNKELNRLNAKLAKATENKDYEVVKEIHSNIGKHINTGLQQKHRFSELTTITTKEQLISKLKEKPDALVSGYTIGESGLLIPTGAITVVAAPTSHGKTTMLINLAIKQALIGRKVHLFSYEENKEAILIKAMNTYINYSLSNDSKRSLASFLKGEEYIIWKPDLTRDILNTKIEEFFQEIISKGLLQIHYVNYSSNKLIESIYHLKEKNLVDVVLIDYIQQLNEESSKLGNKRYEEIKVICNHLKNCAVDTKLPIIAGAQFNRTVTSLDKMHLSAIGEAGDIERITSLGVGLWNHNFPQLDKNGRIPEDFTPLKAITLKVLKDRDGGLAWKEETFEFDGNKGTLNNCADDNSLNPYSAKKDNLSIPFDQPSLNHSKIKGGRKKKYPIHDPYTARDYKEETDGY